MSALGLGDGLAEFGLPAARLFEHGETVAVRRIDRIAIVRDADRQIADLVLADTVDHHGVAALGHHHLAGDIEHWRCPAGGSVLMVILVPLASSKVVVP